VIKQEDKNGKNAKEADEMRQSEFLRIKEQPEYISEDAPLGG